MPTGVELYQALFDAVEDAITVKDLRGRYVAVNLEMTRRVGRTEAELLGKTAREVYPPEVGRRIEDDALHVLRNGEALDSYVEHPERQYARVCHVRRVPLRDTSGNVVGLVTVSRDITERRRAEEALHQSEEMLRLVVDNSPDVMYLQDRDLRYQWVVNPPLSLAPETMLGKTEFDLFPAEEARALRDAKMRVMQTGVTYRAEVRATIGGEERVFDLVVQPRRDQDGSIVGVAGYSRDVTDRKRLEERLLLSQRLETAGQLAAEVAHDLNILLAPMATYLDLIKMNLPPGHPSYSHCGVMATSVQRMADVIADTMVLGANVGAARRMVDLNSLARDVAVLIAEPPRTLTIELELEPDLLPVYGSPPQLQRVLSILLANAREAVRDAGSISVRTENVYIEEPLERYDRIEAGEYVRLSVADTGPGIPVEQRDRIFDPFFTPRSPARARGGGLGLTLVQSLVRSHRGYLDVESEEGKGTVFSVYLPVSRRSREQKPPRGLRGGSETILVVDDDRLQLEVVEDLLGRLGYKVKTARSGEEAVAHLLRHQVDLVVLDMIMPPGIDGAETYRRILEVRPGQKAVIMSGYPESDLVRSARLLGAGPYLHKPLTMEQLGQAVRDVLDQSVDPPGDIPRSSQ